MRAALIRLITSTITSPRTRSLRRWRASLPRKLSGSKPCIHYFHEPQDPYSQLAAQLISPLTERYDVEIKSFRVSAPDRAAAPELEKLQTLAKTDAAILAKAFNLLYPAANSISLNSEDGDQRRKKLGHYLSAMFYFEGEWYWGVDRFHFLEERLWAEGFARDKSSFKAIAAAKEVTFAGAKNSAKGATLDYYLSFRSPYTYIAAERVRKLAEHYGAELRLRFVLPMVMRGLPVPASKRFYILFDTKREAERLGLPFGTIVDPVGRPTERGLAVLHQAIQAGKGMTFAESFLKGVFAEGVDADSDQGLINLATRAGLDNSLVDRALKDETWRTVAEANRQELFDLGLWGVPSFRVNANRPHWGQDRLWVIEQELQQLKICEARFVI